MRLVFHFCLATCILGHYTKDFGRECPISRALVDVVSKLLRNCSVTSAHDGTLDPFGPVYKHLVQEFRPYSTLKLQNGSEARMAPSVRQNDHQCSVYVISSTQERLGIMAKFVSERMAVRTVHDYFLFFHPLGESSVAAVLLEETSRLKFKVEMEAIQFGERMYIDFKSLCFHCDGGGPEIISVGSYFQGDFWQISKMEDLFPDWTRNAQGASVRVACQLSVWKKADYETHKLNYFNTFYYYDVLNEATSRLNFTWECSSYSNNHKIQYRNKTLMGMAGPIAVGEVNMSFFQTVTPDMLQLIDFSWPYLYDDVTLVTSPPKDVPSWTAIIRPYTITMWILLTFTMAACAVSIYIFLLPTESTGSKITLGRASQIMATILVEQATWYPRADSSRMVVIFWILGGIILTCGYKTKMVSFVVSPVKEAPMTTFIQLAESNYHVGVSSEYQSNILQLFRHSNSTEYVNLAERAEVFSSEVQCMEKAMVDRCACIVFRGLTTRYFLFDFTNIDGTISVHVSSESAFMSLVGFGFPKDYIYKPAFDHVLQHFQDKGLLYKWLYNEMKWLHNIAITEAKKHNRGSYISGPHPFKLYNLEGPFYLLIAGFIFSNVVITAELALHYFLRNGH